jgi:hypothetical protein
MAVIEALLEYRWAAIYGFCIGSVLWAAFGPGRKHVGQ